MDVDADDVIPQGREQAQEHSWFNQFRATRAREQRRAADDAEQARAAAQARQLEQTELQAQAIGAQGQADDLLSVSSSHTRLGPPSSFASVSHSPAASSSSSQASPAQRRRNHDLSGSTAVSPDQHSGLDLGDGGTPGDAGSEPRPQSATTSTSTLPFTHHRPSSALSAAARRSKPIPISVLPPKGGTATRAATRHSPYPPLSALRSTHTMSPSASARPPPPPSALASAHTTPPSLSASAAAAAAARLTSPTPSMSSSARRRQAPLFPNSPRQDQVHGASAPTLTPTPTPAGALPYSPFRSSYMQASLGSHGPRPPRQVGVPITPRTASHVAHHPYRPPPPPQPPQHPPPSASAPPKLADPAYPITGPYFLVPSPTRRNAKGEPEMDVVPAVPTAAAILHLRASAGQFWNAPETADIILSIPADRDATKPQHKTAMDVADGMEVPDGRRRSEGDGAISTINFYAHMSYLTARSALLRRVLATPNPVDPKGLRFMPTVRESHLNLWIPVPDTRSFALLLHWIYWGDDKALDVALKDGTANWKGLVANVQFLEMDGETKFAVGMWWKKWVKTGVGRDGEVVDRGLRRTPRVGDDEDDEDESDHGPDNDQDRNSRPAQADAPDHVQGRGGRTAGAEHCESTLRASRARGAGEDERLTRVGGMATGAGARTDGAKVEMEMDGEGDGGDGSRTRGEDEVVGLLKQL